jgi:DNA-binding transcriptional regulator YdaS (Cro superfamily)
MTLSEYLHDKNVVAFARRIGVSHQHVYRILNGQKSPSSKLMAVIRDATGGAVQPNDFVPEYNLAVPQRTAAAALRVPSPARRFGM